MLTRYFEQEGYRVSVAADGAAMRAQLKSSPVDVILLDVVMPGEDGLTLAREIRATSDVGIIMLTGRDDVARPHRRARGRRRRLYRKALSSARSVGAG